MVELKACAVAAVVASVLLPAAMEKAVAIAVAVASATAFAVAVALAVPDPPIPVVKERFVYNSFNELQLIRTLSQGFR